MMANCVDTACRLLWTWLFVLMTASVARAGEYCSYTRLDRNSFEHHTSYCDGYCCEEDARRCCVDHHYTALLIGIILAGGVFLAVVVIVIVVLCKRANMKRARVRDQELAVVYDAAEHTGRSPHYPRGAPGVFHINPPSYSASHNQGKPPAYPGSIRSGDAYQGQPSGGVAYPGPIRNDGAFPGQTRGGDLHADPFRSGNNDLDPIRGGATNLPPIRGLGNAGRDPRSEQGGSEQGGARGETGDNPNRVDLSSSTATRYPWDSGHYNWDMGKEGGVGQGPQDQQGGAKNDDTGGNSNRVNLSNAKDATGDNSNSVNISDVNRESPRYPAWESGHYDWDLGGGTGHPAGPPPAYTYEEK